MAAVQCKSFKFINHFGNRPKDDQDNTCREKLSHLVRDRGCFFEMCSEKLYMIYLAKDEDSKEFCEQVADDPKSPFIFWSMHDSPSLNYEPFSLDFGPFNLATTHQFFSKLKIWLDTQALRNPDKYIVVVLDEKDTKKKLNATLLVAAAAMVLLNLTDQEVIQRLGFFMMYKGKPGEVKKELVFREIKKFTDVSGHHSVMALTLEDCIRAFYAAIQLKFYDYYEFDQAEYLFYETVMSGDLNWIVPGKLMAFAGPSDKPHHNNRYHKHPPRFYFQYFKDHNVTSIVRLNDREYDSSGFIDQGFEHFDLIFPDGYPPTSTIAAKFIKIVDEAKGAVAVHCYAGIGRTGTLIAAYLMARYKFTPQMAIGWTRICRPGSVIGEQEDWLCTKFDHCSINKSQIKQTKNKKTKASQREEPIIEVLNKAEIAANDVNQTTSYSIAERTYGQAKALILAKKQRENYEKPTTRNSSLMKSELEQGTGSSNREPQQRAKRANLVLDLGKTIPLMLYLPDFENLSNGENPKFYTIKESRYEWKVKFPEPRYVALKHDIHNAIRTAKEYNVELKRIQSEPILDFKYEHEDLPSNLNGLKELPKTKPVVYYSLLVMLF